MPAGSNALERFLQGVKISGYASQLIERQFLVGDRVFEAMGRIRLVATRRELEVIDALETAIGEWTIGHPMPDSFRDALPRLRRLLEERQLLVDRGWANSTPSRR
jgi:hypothetical protein